MEIIGEHTSLALIFKMLDKVAPTDSTVLVTGESGTGKELMVRALHTKSLRAQKAFVPINCGAIPKDLLESELFGHEKGAFTGAISTKPGRFEVAEGGTIFLDEIGEMDMSLQVKILRVLQEKEIERVGGIGPKKVDVRIVAATNRDLEKEVETGRFREDLYYRLNVIPIHLPPLRDRGDDKLILIQHFLTHFCKRKERKTLVLSPRVKHIFMSYSWPGNVRELENVMERLSILVDGNVVEDIDVPQKILNSLGEDFQIPDCNISPSTPVSMPEQDPSITVQTFFNPVQNSHFVYPCLADLEASTLNLKEFLESIENKLIDEALIKAENVKNLAAEMLGIKRTTLIEKLKKKNIE